MLSTEEVQASTYRVVVRAERMRVHPASLKSRSPEHVEARLAAALAAGGRIVDDSASPGAWILADRAGNRVCIAAWPDGATVGDDAAAG